jgi:DNA-binding MarR family transcriptional regulator
MSETQTFSQIVRQWMDTFMHRSMRGWSQFVKSTGLSMPQFSILMQLYHKGASGMSELSERFGISPAAASQLVDKLVQADLLLRTENPNDRRAKQVALTARGKQLIEQGIAERYRWMEKLDENLSLEERNKVAEALKILDEAAKELDV